MFNNSLEHFMEQFGEPFIIVRNAVEITQVNGLKNTQKSRHITLFPDTDVQVGDWLKSPVSNEEFYIFDVQSVVAQSKVEEIKAFYQTKAEFEKDKEHPHSVTFNIQNAQGSIIGTQKQATIHNSYNLEELKKIIDQNAKEDKEELHQLVETLKAITTNNIPVQKGTLARFSDVMQRNTWLSGPVAQALIGWVTGK